jgi:hypothetical protein
MTDPRRMTPEEFREAEGLLRQAATTRAPAEASAALDELMRRLLTLHRVLEAEQRITGSGIGTAEPITVNKTYPYANS